MTPKQIANNLALVVMADMENVDQALASASLLQKTIPHLRDALIGHLEVASNVTPADLHMYYSSMFLHSILQASTEEDDTSLVSDEDIENDGVSDDEEEESDSFVAEEINLASAVSQLKEVAAGMVIRDKGKFLPLDDIEVVELKTAKLLDTARKAVAAEATTVKRKNVFGKIRAAE